MNNEKKLRHAEAFANFRRLLLTVNALAYMLWVGPQAGYFFGWFASIDSANQVIAPIAMIAGPIWLISLLLILAMIFYLYRRRDLAGLIDDERTKNLTKRAFQAGYFTLLIIIALSYALCFFGKMPNILALLPILLSIGVAVPSLTYALLYRS